MYDVIIIGSGSAGGVLAGRLSEDPNRNVLLLEAGGRDWNPMFRFPSMHTLLFKTPWDWDYTTVPQPGLLDRRVFVPRGKVLGGCSNTNSTVYIRGHRADYDRWAHDEGCDGWAYDDVLPYFKVSEDNERGDDAFHGEGGPLTISEPRSPNPVCVELCKAGGDLGYPMNEDFNGERQEGLGVYQVNQRRGLRVSSVDGWLRPARHRENLDIRTRAQVTKILFEGHRATGVEYVRRGRRFRVFADRIVLSAGAIGSPKILLASGVGPADQLRGLGVTVIRDLPGVGENYQDHLQSPTIFHCQTDQTYTIASLAHPGNIAQMILHRRGPLTTNVVETGGFVRTRDGESVPDVQYHFAPVFALHNGFEQWDGYYFTMLTVLLRPKSRGTLRLRSANPLDKPILDPRFFSEPEDLETVVRGTKIAREIAAAPRMKDIAGHEALPGPGATTDEDLRNHIRKHIETVYHPVGTCKMGTDPLAVVDPRLQVHGVDGLSVVDASVMPSIIGGNTNAPTIMIAERAAEWLAS